MKLPELKQNLRTLNTNPVDLAVIEYVTPYKICVAALLHEYVRTHHMFSRILNFLFVVSFARKKYLRITYWLLALQFILTYVYLFKYLCLDI